MQISADNVLASVDAWRRARRARAIACMGISRGWTLSGPRRQGGKGQPHRHEGDKGGQGCQGGQLLWRCSGSSQLRLSMAAGHLHLSCPWTDSRCSERADATFFGALPLGGPRGCHLHHVSGGMSLTLLYRAFKSTDALRLYHVGAII